MTSPTVSVIVPTCERPAELSRALESVRAQTRPADEVVVVDDAQRRGAGAARNLGVARSSGSFLAFLDDDDEWLPGYLESALRLAERDDLELVCTDLLLQRPGQPARPGKQAPHRLRPADFLTRNPGLGGSNTIVRREVFDAVGGFDETLPTLNDMDFGLRLALDRPRYGPVRRPLVVFNHHAGPRLSVVGSQARRDGLVRFFELHAHRMSPQQELVFRQRMVREGVTAVDGHRVGASDRR